MPCGGFELESGDLGDSRLEAGGKIGNLLRGELVFELIRGRSNGELKLLLDGAEDGGFETTEGKVETVDVWNRQMIFVRVTLEGGLSNGGAAWIGETEDFGDFVEDFADGVVTSAADNMEIVVVSHVDNLGVTTGDDESE